MRELASDSGRPITFYINSAGATDGLAIHDSIRHIVSLESRSRSMQNGVSMGSIVLQAASRAGAWRSTLMI